jgi:hypothetical protein
MPRSDEPCLFTASERRWAVAGGAWKRDTVPGEAEFDQEASHEAATAGLELFQSANGTATDSAGYERWKAGMAAAR